MLRFNKWLRRKNRHSTTPVHYTNDLELFFHWCQRAPDQVSVRDVDAFVEHCQQRGHAVATINRRLAALCSFYHFLAVESDAAPANPVLPKRHFIRLGRQLPHDVQDPDMARLFAVITTPRDRAMYLLIQRFSPSQVADTPLRPPQKPPSGSRRGDNRCAGSEAGT